jgi:hypothetical protein
MDRQRVHIGAKADGSVGLATGEGGDDAVATNARDERDAKFSEPGLDKGSGFAFVQRQLRVGVEMAAPFGQPVVQGFVQSVLQFSSAWNGSGSRRAGQSDDRGPQEMDQGAGVSLTAAGGTTNRLAVRVYR